MRGRVHGDRVEGARVVSGIEVWVGVCMSEV